MENIIILWKKSVLTTLGLFWMAFWAFALGYLISSMIQVFVTRERMKRNMGDAGITSVGLGTFFGFISSSCSFAALSTTRALFVKGAGLIPSLAFLLASTNLVIELGIVIAVFLAWQFVVGEYLGGLILIILMSLIVKLTQSKKLIQDARSNAREQQIEESNEEIPNWRKLIKTKEGWVKVAQQYMMEWQMVWKDVTIGFTVAGIIAVFIPKTFFQALFPGAGLPDASFLQILGQTLVGPLAAFFTFIGSMGNIPLAAVLFANGVSFAGIMAFIFSDLVVLPVLRIQAKYYGWKMAFYILGVFLTILVLTALIIHYLFAMFDLLPAMQSVNIVKSRDYFTVNYSFVLNVIFIFITGFFLVLKKRPMKLDLSTPTEKVLLVMASIALAWIFGGLVIRLLF